jgi:DNA-binding response OmpR family regulator
MPKAEPRVRVLLVEDEILISDLIEMILESTRFEVIGTAETGAQALALAERARPELALVDINLKGGMDGLEVAARLRELCDPQIVFATGSNDPSTRVRVDALAPAGFLAKPFTPHHLIRLLEALCPRPTT